MLPSQLKTKFVFTLILVLSMCLNVITMTQGVKEINFVKNSNKNIHQNFDKNLNTTLIKYSRDSFQFKDYTVTADLPTTEDDFLKTEAELDLASLKCDPTNKERLSIVNNYIKTHEADLSQDDINLIKFIAGDCLPVI